MFGSLVRYWPPDQLNKRQHNTYDLTDAQGSVLMSLSASTALGEQVYGPYSNQHYTTGAMGIDKGCTGHVQNNVTGLDYYSARSYDPVAGVFLSPDTVQGNAQGMSPYAYVAQNPETKTDPTGQRFCPTEGSCGGDSGGGGAPPPPPTQPTPPSNPCELSGGNPQYCPTQPPPTGGCHGGGTKTGANCTTGGKPTKPTKPTLNRRNNAKNVAGNAAAFFFGLALIVGGLSRILTWLSEQLLQWGSDLLLTGPWGWVFGAILLGLGATAAVLAWQANKLFLMMDAVGAMYLGEQRMPDSWWTPDAIQAFGVGAGTVATAVGVFVDFRSFFSKLPGTLTASIVNKAAGTLVAGRGLGAALGFLSGEAIARQIDYYTGLEITCLTQASCAAS